MKESIYERFISKIYDPFLRGAEKKYLEHRRNRLIAGLRGHVLDVGSGTGVNFPHFHKDSNVTAVEPSPSMAARAVKKYEDVEHIQLHVGGIGQEHIDNMFEEESLDAIVCTLVLCTIPDPDHALKLFYRWLKPTGKLIILEHIRAEDRMAAKIQDWATPLWRTVALGCHLNRPTDIMIKESGFIPLSEEKFNLVFPFYEASFTKQI